MCIFKVIEKVIHTQHVLSCLWGVRLSDKVIVYFGKFKWHREKGCGIVAKSQFGIRCITFCVKLWNCVHGRTTFFSLQHCTLTLLYYKIHADVQRIIYWHDYLGHIIWEGPNLHPSRLYSIWIQTSAAHMQEGMVSTSTCRKYTVS